MRINLMIEAQEGLTYADLLAAAQRAEAAGLEGFYRSDHYKSVASREHLGSTDAWATLAGLARETDRLRLGTLVSPATFRYAGNLAKVVATVTDMAGAVDGASRIDLGLGTGWHEAEHRQHGFPFEDTATRFRRLREHLEVVTALWDPAQQRVDFDGEFCRIENGRFEPPPSPRPRIIVGGKGLKTTPALAARYADELNGIFASPAAVAEQRAALDAACRDADRDPGEVTYSIMTGCVLGATEAEFTDRARALHERSSSTDDFDDWLDGLRDEWILGTPEQARQRLADYADAGLERIMLQHQLADDLAMIDVAADVLA